MVKRFPGNGIRVNMFGFHITVPPGASALDIVFDFISAPEAPGFSSGGSATTELAVLNWNQVLLYPQGVPGEQLRYQANLPVQRHGALERPCRSRGSPGTKLSFNPRR